MGEGELKPALASQKLSTDDNVPVFSLEHLATYTVEGMMKLG